MKRPSTAGAFLAGMLLLAGCSAQSAGTSGVAAVPVTTPAVPTASTAPTSPPAVSAAPLTTSSGFRLGAPDVRSSPAKPLVPDSAPDRGLQSIRAPKGAAVLAPVGWRALPTASLSQQVCVQGSCVDVQEDILVMAAPGGQESMAIFGVDVPPDVGGGAILDDLLRGVVTGFSARSPDTKIVEGPGAIDLPGASKASALRATFTEPATGNPATMFVEAAAHGQQVGGVFVITSDDYLQSHLDEIARIQASFRLASVTN